MERPLAEYFGEVYATDIHDYGRGEFGSLQQPWPRVQDFLTTELVVTCDFIIANPPFSLAEQFIERALQTAGVGVAMLVRSQFLEGQGRYNRLFSVSPPTIIAQFVERVPMLKGRCLRKASTASSYVWLVWVQGRKVDFPAFRWIAPCRSNLEVWGDYDGERPEDQPTGPQPGDLPAANERGLRR